MDAPVVQAPAKAGREPVYDVARLTAILCVVLIHALSPLVDGELTRLGHAGAIVLTSRILRFSVPAFAMLTGALLWPRPFGGARSWGAFFRRRLSAVLAPFLVWSVIYLAAGIPLELVKQPTWRQLWGMFLLGTTWYHLYFIPIIIGIYLLTPLAVPLVRWKPWAALVAAVCIAMAAGPLLGQVSLRPHPELEGLLMRIARFLPYAAAGAWYAAERERWAAWLRRAWPWVLGAGLALRVVQVGEWLPLKWDGGGRVLDAVLVKYEIGVLAFDVTINILATLALLGIADAALRALPRLAPIATAWAPYSFGLYLAHPFAIGALMFGAPAIGLAWPLPWWAMVFVVWPVVSVGVLWLVRGLSHFPWLWWLTGVRGPSRAAPPADVTAG